MGAPVGANRIDAVRRASAKLGAVLLLKGPTTVVADPSGAVRVVTSGTPTLATAGSGDVLSGMIGGTLARGLPPLLAASLAAHLHGRAGARCSTYAPASSIPEEVTRILDEVRQSKTVMSL
jgi:NAD(P)H-hydrate repair Nnr-like enzyme with NAD(P)H-hydrate dehydratase domain